MKKRVFSLLLALSLTLGLAVSASAADTGYSDVPEGHWSAESVRRATELGLFNGVGGGKFGRGQPISRAAFVTALVRLFDWQEITPTQATFTDVTADRWFYSAVETACANGAVVAIGKNFRPTDNLSREEMAVMLVRGLGYASLAGAAARYSSPFTDVSVSRGFITVAYDMGIMSGIGDGKFAPDAPATREQAAAVLVRVYDRLYAASCPLTDAGSRRTITVETPTVEEGAEFPTTPLEPVTALYDALRELKSSGADMGQAVLCLTAGGVRTLMSGKRILDTAPVSAQEVEEILAKKDVRTYLSPLYDSAYCIYQANSYQTGILWYQSPESLEAKLCLARLFGVNNYLMLE